MKKQPKRLSLTKETLSLLQGGNSPQAPSSGCVVSQPPLSGCHGACTTGCL